MSWVGTRPYADSIFSVYPDGSGIKRLISASKERSYMGLSGQTLASSLVVQVHEKASESGKAEDHLYLHRLNSNYWQKLETPGGSAGSPAVSLDGSQVAFVFRRNSEGFNYRLWVYDLGKHFARQLSLDESPDAWDASPSWRPDGLEIIFLRLRITQRGLVSNLMRVSPTEGEPSSFPHLQESVVAACYAPDGKSLAILSVNGLEVVQLEGTRRAIILPRAPVSGYRFFAGGICWGRLAGKIAFIITDKRARRYQLWSVSPDGSDRKLMYEPGEGMLVSPQFILD